MPFVPHAQQDGAQSESIVHAEPGARTPTSATGAEGHVPAVFSLESDVPLGTSASPGTQAIGVVLLPGAAAVPHASAARVTASVNVLVTSTRVP